MASSLLHLRNQVRDRCSELNINVRRVFDVQKWSEYEFPYVYPYYEESAKYEHEIFNDGTIGSNSITNIDVYVLTAYSVETDTSEDDLLGDAAENARDVVLKQLRNWVPDNFRDGTEHTSFGAMIPMDSERVLVSADGTKGYSVVHFQVQLETNYL